MCFPDSRNLNYNLLLSRCTLNRRSQEAGQVLQIGCGVFVLPAQELLLCLHFCLGRPSWDWIWVQKTVTEVHRPHWGVQLKPDYPTPTFLTTSQVFHSDLNFFFFFFCLQAFWVKTYIFFFFKILFWAFSMHSLTTLRPAGTITMQSNDTVMTTQKKELWFMGINLTWLLHKL